LHGLIAIGTYLLHISRFLRQPLTKQRCLYKNQVWKCNFFRIFSILRQLVSLYLLGYKIFLFYITNAPAFYKNFARQWLQVSIFCCCITCMYIVHHFSSWRLCLTLRWDCSSFQAVIDKIRTNCRKPFDKTLQDTLKLNVWHGGKDKFYHITPVFGRMVIWDRRVARFFLVQLAKNQNGEKIPKYHKMYQMITNTLKYT
jgi:hypothetical protein